MSKDNLYVGLDIGSSKVAICVGTVIEGETRIIALAAVPHSGLRKGVITDPEETVSAISHVLDEAEQMAGAPITHAFVSINGSHIETVAARGVIAVSKPNGQIAMDDVERVVDAAKTATLPQNRELIHLFPIRYIIDGQEESRDPIGMNGIRLELDALVISSSSAAVRNLYKVIEQAGITLDGLVFSPLATARALTTKKQRESGVILIDIGAGTTDIAVYEEGQLLHAACLPVGSTHITNDIAIGLRTNLDVAETIKIKYGITLPQKIREGEMINLATLDPAETEKVSRKHVAEIIDARVSEIFSLVKNELKQIGKDAVLPAGAVFTGGGCDLEGLTETARATLRLPATIGYPITTLSGMVDKIDSPLYATSVGLVLWALEESDGGASRWPLDFGKFGGVVDRFRGIFKNFTN